MSQEFNYGTGKRKNAVARTRVFENGQGDIYVNDRPFEDFFPRKSLQMIVQQPLKLTKTHGRVDVKVTVDGGGVSGQAYAVRHGISRALCELSDEYRGVLKRAGFLTRDDRKKERKKYGLRGARARFQYSKR
jgi:small subunit ribosomal protein S9